ncbi:IS5 family transposase [Salinibacter ruber]|uniref:IS5 family transposase n=1 Tax=Salinibacter ruber TaxID=146919 RepID=UPI003C6E5F4B
MAQYPSDLTDAEWKQIEPIFDRFRFDEHDPRSLLNAVFYVLKTGSQWRMLPSDYPPWQTVYYHFRKWRRLDLLQRLCDRIRRAARIAAGRRPSPSAAVIDTQSVDTERQGGPGRGRDPNKKVKGRKRHVIVDTLCRSGVEKPRRRRRLEERCNQHLSRKPPLATWTLPLRSFGSTCSSASATEADLPRWPSGRATTPIRRSPTRRC